MRYRGDSANILRRIEHLNIEKETFQEDWGVIFYTSFRGSLFWIGLSFADIDWWAIHFHPKLLQHLRTKAKKHMEELIEAVTLL